MPITNAKIADIFNEMADLLDIEGENPFRVRAYRTAARVINSLTENLTDMVKEHTKLTELPGIITAIAEKIEVAGSYSRSKDTVGDLDILVIGRKGTAIISYFTQYDEIQEIWVNRHKRRNLSFMMLLTNLQRTH